jgi:acyl carrier protein
MMSEKTMDQQTVVAAARQVVAGMIGANVGDDESLILSGRIDSLSILKLIARLEQALNITMPAAQLQPEDFDTIDLIVETVTRVARPR